MASKGISAVPPIMILKDSSNNRLLFKFQSLQWGVGTAVVAIVLSVMTYHAFNRDDIPLFMRLFVLFLSMAFTYSSFYSFTTRRTLEINFTEKVVTLLDINLFRKKTRREPFNQYERITVYRPTARAMNYYVRLESTDGVTENLGWNVFGARSLGSAMDLVNMIAPKMGIEINAPTYFEEKSLAKQR